jgi:hypothetical protein
LKHGTSKKTWTKILDELSKDPVANGCAVPTIRTCSTQFESWLETQEYMDKSFPGRSGDTESWDQFEIILTHYKDDFSLWNDMTSKQKEDARKTELTKKAKIEAIREDSMKALKDKKKDKKRKKRRSEEDENKSARRGSDRVDIQSYLFERLQQSKNRDTTFFNHMTDITNSLREGFNLPPLPPRLPPQDMN